jgi:prepilin-type N-terminal cleavage/methylation domain-containing protein
MFRSSTRSRGFTLIELLLVVVIIGIVAALVLPKFGDVKQKAYVAAMKSDLRNFATAEEIYADKGGAFTTDASPTGPLTFTSSDNVTIAVSSATADGFTATATHSKVGSAVTCSLAYGTGAANKVACTGDTSFVPAAPAANLAPTADVALSPFYGDNNPSCQQPGVNTFRINQCRVMVTVSNIQDAQGDADVNTMEFVVTGFTTDMMMRRNPNATTVEQDIGTGPSSPGTGSVTVTLHDLAGHTRNITVPLTLIP